MGKLSGKIALITGASRGIGRAIAVALASEAATVAIHYNTALPEAEKTLSLVENAGGTGFVLRADLGVPDGHRILSTALKAGLEARFGSSRFDILVNNAGVGKRVTIEQTTEVDFDRVVQVNLKTPFFLIQSLLPHLADGGRIINISSMGARAAYPDMPIYAPTKAGLEVLSRILAVHLGPRGITVNAVMPGATATDMNIRARDPEASKAIAQTIALGRVGQPEDIARIVAFLASGDGGWVTGQSIDASGGQRL